jgi:hypothetical protein
MAISKSQTYSFLYLNHPSKLNHPVDHWNRNRVTARKNRTYLEPIPGKVEPYFTQAASARRQRGWFLLRERSRVIKKEGKPIRRMGFEKGTDYLPSIKDETKKVQDGDETNKG